MQRDTLRTFFEASPTVRLLRSELAPLVVEFLERTFKSGEAIAFGQAELRLRLAAFQEDLHEQQPELMVGPPERYLSHWVDAGWLQRFLEASSMEPQYQLTRYAEEAIRFVDAALARGQSLVGTESRLRLVIESLEDLVRGATADPERRLTYLRRQRAVLDREIEALESGKSVEAYRPAQVRERFQNAVELLKALQSDFRAVEERFQEIARDVQRLQATGYQTRGGILGYALDAEDLLKQQDEGTSFFAFVAFLFSPTQQAALRKTIEELQQLAPLADQTDSLARVRQMVPSLLAEAEKVMRTTARLSATLRRMLDGRAAAHRMRLASVLAGIRQAALQLADAPKDRLPQLRVDAELTVMSPLARTLWTPPQRFTDVEPEEHVIDLQTAQQLAASFARLQRLDMRRLRATIREATHAGEPATLGQLLGRSPPSGGIVELLAYLQIAHDDGHRVDASLTETITLAPSRGNAGLLRVSVPQVTFLPKAGSTSGGRKPR